jgi:hypothetical protein
LIGCPLGGSYRVSVRLHVCADPVLRTIYKDYCVGRRPLQIQIQIQNILVTQVTGPYMPVVRLARIIHLQPLSWGKYTAGSGVCTLVDVFNESFLPSLCVHEFSWIHTRVYWPAQMYTLTSRSRRSRQERGCGTGVALQADKCGPPCYCRRAPLQRLKKNNY